MFLSMSAFERERESTQEAKPMGKSALREFVRRIREWRQMSEAELARRSGVKQRTINDWQSEVTEELRASAVLDILRALGVSAGTLDQIGRGATAADGAAVAESVITRLALEERLRSDPADRAAREAYVRWRYGELVMEGYDVPTARSIVDHELSLIALRASPPGQGGA